MDVQKLLATIKTMPLGEVYAFAIERERDAQTFYQEAAEVVTNPGARTLLADLYEEEVDHERILTEAREGGQVELVGKPRGFVELGLAEMMPDVKVLPQSTVQDILIRAIKKEAFAVEFYKAATAQTDDETAKKLFARLVEEETQHKAMLETWYDDHILRDN
ncbi:MAG: ferritin family protein [Candidatus Lernaella stagnicola]|nr:ferritin family protein [Candidatus Lernaella stagnicola]